MPCASLIKPINVNTLINGATITMSTEIKHTPDDAVDLLDQYVNASADSASRARTILLVMITMSVLVFVAYWNTQPDAWLTGRINKATTALWLFDRETKNPLTMEEATRKLEEAKQKSPGAQDFPGASDLTEAKGFIAARHINDFDLLLKYIEDLRNLQLESATTLHAPFFGVAFDVNDLGLFGGITFIVILLWFRFSLVRERDNLKQVFEEAKRLGDDYYHHSYHLLSMRQVLTIPPSLHEPKTVSNTSGLGIWRILPQILLFLPSLCYILLFYHDWKTFPVASTVSRSNSWRLLAMNSICLVIIIIINVICVRRSNDVDKEWETQARKLRMWEEKQLAASLDKPDATGETATKITP